MSQKNRYLCGEMIDRRTIDRIMDAANIVDVVSDFVSLRKRGTSYKGLCPFHDDTTPSFSVSPSRGVFKCFACGKAGNAVAFIMEHEQMTYVEALRYLAKKYHIEIEEREQTAEEREAQNVREGMFIVNDWASQFFHHVLLNDTDGKAIGLQYFHSRGIRDDIIERFRLGYAPRQRYTMSRQAQKEGYNTDYLVSTGLCYEREEKGEEQEKEQQTDEKGKNVHRQLVDRFAGRVIFPWQSISGKVVAFGGRLLDSRTKGVAQKYVNSPDSDIYHKDHELYGIFQAKRAISKEDRVYMVEGYTDVIAMHQCGIENVVANSGTALSVHQIKLLRRFTDNVTLLYDGDEAGIHAAFRGTDMLLEEGMNVKILLLPDEEDPDSFARKHTAEEFRQYIKEHEQDFLVFKTTYLLRNVTDPIQRSQAITDIVGSIAVIQNQIVKATYVKECSIRIGISEETLIAEMNKMIDRNKEEKRRQQRTNNNTETPQTNASLQALKPIATPFTPRKENEVEQQLMEMVIKKGEEVLLTGVMEEDNRKTCSLNVAQYIQQSLQADDIHFETPLYETILSEAVEQSRNEGFKADYYFTRHPNIDISTLAVYLSTEKYQLSKSLQMATSEQTLLATVDRLLLAFRLQYVENKLKAFKKQLVEQSDDEKAAAKTLQEIMKLQSLRNTIAKHLGRNSM